MHACYFTRPATLFVTCKHKRKKKKSIQSTSWPMLFHAEKGGELSEGRAGSEHPDQKKKTAPIKKIREKSALEKQVYRNQTNRVECFPLESPSSLLIE